MTDKPIGEPACVACGGPPIDARTAMLRDDQGVNQRVVLCAPCYQRKANPAQTRGAVSPVPPADGQVDGLQRVDSTAPCYGCGRPTFMACEGCDLATCGLCRGGETRGCPGCQPQPPLNRDVIETTLAALRLED